MIENQIPVGGELDLRAQHFADGKIFQGALVHCPVPNFDVKAVPRNNVSLVRAEARINRGIKCLQVERARPVGVVGGGWVAAPAHLAQIVHSHLAFYC